VSAHLPTVTDASRLVFLFGGPAAAGKTTLARAWCLTRPRAVHIEFDSVRSLMVSGLADPQARGALQHEQYVLCVDTCCSLAKAFCAAGYDVAIDDDLPKEAFDAHWLPKLEGVNYRVLVLLPDLKRRSGAPALAPNACVNTSFASSTRQPTPGLRRCVSILRI